MKTAEITVEYLDHMGTDLTVVNAARTSFGKESYWDDRYSTLEEFEAGEGTMVRKLKPTDASLIRFLATGFRTQEWDALLEEVSASKDKAELTDILQAYKRGAQHWAPFAHPHMQIRMKLPMFLARQFVKHQIGGVWSEESRRYMSSEPEFWFPKDWHTRPGDVKQGAGDVHEDSDMWGRAAQEKTKEALAFYLHAVASGIAPEEARIVLPLNTMTTVTWTGSLLFWSRVSNQRQDSHAQKAANDLGGQLAALAQPLFPVSWAALAAGGNENLLRY